MKSNISFIALVALVGVLALSLFGCGESDLGNQVSAPPSSDDAIKRIESNTHMPAEAKAAAIKQIKDREAAGKAMANDAKNGKLSAK